MGAHQLLYRQPAEAWTQALPLGNGRIGAMCFGGSERERLQINDATAWSGGPGSELAGSPLAAAEAASGLARARQLLRDGDPQGADQELRSFQHRYSQSYQPFADLIIGIKAPDESAAGGYTRTLDLATAAHTVVDRRESGGVVEQQTIISRPHDVLVWHLRATHPDGVDVEFAVDAAHPLVDRRDQVSAPDAAAPVSQLLFRLPADVSPPHDIEMGLNADLIDRVYDGVDSLHGALTVAWVHDGEASPGDPFAARRVRQATIIVTTGTTFAGLGQPIETDVESVLENGRLKVRAALADGYEKVRQAQRDDHARLYDRVGLSLAATDADNLPIDRRLQRLAGNVTTEDPGLVATLFHYGRYLLICSSRPGNPPANLQGIWNAEGRPTWSSNYTLNINLQMNYWLAATTNLLECAEPLLAFCQALSRRGRETAARLYGVDGWVVHHNSDIWCHTAPIGNGIHPSWVPMWPMGSVWLAMQLTDLQSFAAADELTPARTWPVVLGAAEFALGWLLEDPVTGGPETNPSTSPENTFRIDDGTGVSGLSRTSTMDLELIRATLEAVTSAADEGLLSTDVDLQLAERARMVLASLPAPTVTTDGRVREWVNDPSEVDPHHRHLSHLVFAYPGTTNLDLDPTLASAVSHSLDLRGNEGTGWSLAWKLGLRARLRQGDVVSELLNMVFKLVPDDAQMWDGGGSYANLFGAHPPFQIDSNLGYVAAVAECLLQSHRDEIELLPALPEGLTSGSYTGLRARPGVLVDLSWQASAPHHVELRSATNETLRDVVVRFGQRRVTLPEIGPAPVVVDLDSLIG